jgi:hypothetical protein
MMRRHAFLVFLVVGLACGVAPTVAQDRLPSHSVGIVPTGELSANVTVAAQSAVRGDGPAKSGGTMGKIGMELALLYFQHRQNGAAGVRALRAAATREPTPRGPSAKSREDRRPTPRVRFPVSSDGAFVTVEAVATEAPSELLEDLRGLGLEGGAAAGNLVSGRLPIEALRRAAGLSSLRGMTPSLMRTHVGRVDSEADTSHGVVQVRENRGLDGSGQKVCALSDSYDNNGSALTTASDDIESGDLPGTQNPEGNTTPIDVLDDEVTDESDEGRAMLQLIHDIAPGAELGFHTAFKGVGNFAQGIRELAGNGCTVIVDDVGSSIEPFYQDGPISNAVNDVVQNDGVAYFSSAGNDGQNSYEASFRNSGEAGVISSSSTRHDFDPGATVDTEQSITIQAGGEFTIFTFQWTDPSAIVEGSDGPDTDLDIALVNAADSIVAQSARDNLGAGVPVESIEYTNESGAEETLNLVIEKAAGPDPDEIKYVYFGSDFQIDEFDTLGPTVYGHPMAEGAMAVAAAPFFNTAAYNSNADPATLAPFSSKGGIPILFDQSGNRLGTPIQRQKPDVTGTDGIDNTFFGFDLPDDFFNGVDADPHPNFFGTSAAAPNVAAIAALIKQARPTMPPTEVYDRLESTAADVIDRANREGEFVAVAEGVDPWSGHGFVRGRQAVPEPRGVQIVNLEASGSVLSGNEGSLELSWRQIGNKSADEFVIERQFFEGVFTERLRVASGNARTYTENIENLPVGTHTFRIAALRNDSTVASRTTSTTLRASDVEVLLYPKPFAQTVNLSVTLPSEEEQERVRVTVFDALGRQVSVPEASILIDGSRSLQFDARRIGLRGNGMYFFRVSGETFTRTVQAPHVQ